jgi:hypothetical protein
MNKHKLLRKLNYILVKDFFGHNFSKGC